MSLEKYFREELDYLRQLGRQAAIEHPHLASFLSEQGSDPDVERLLEGFAFLTGNLRAKIDDQFPELTHGLLHMLWPNYLRPTPSMTIIQYTPNDSAITKATQIQRGTQIKSRPLADDNEDDEDEDTYLSDTNTQKTGQGNRCTFTLCRDVWLFPMSIRDISVNNSNEQGVIGLNFTSKTELTLQELQLDKLRFYLSGDDYSSTQLYFWLSYYLEDAKLVVGNTTISLPDFDFVPVGFNREDALLPYPKNAYMGYRVLQEYFCFSEGFLFFDVTGIPKLPADLKTTDFTLNLYFSEALPPEIKIRQDTFRLHCVPAINLFPMDGEVIQLNGSQSEYPLRANYSHPDRYDIFSIDKVESWLVGPDGKPKLSRDGRRSYVPFESFHHQIEHESELNTRYFRIRIKESPFRKGLEHYISFVRGDESQLLLSEENVSIRLTCTNRELPLQLRVGDIDYPLSGNSSFATFRNITRPSVPLYPLMSGEYHWSLISNMSLNYMTLLDKDALKAVLRTYDLPSRYNRQSSRSSQKRLDAIERIETRQIDRLFKGLPVRGSESTLYIRQQAFCSEGELYMFCNILSRFFALYASVNSFHMLKVINLDNQECYQWPEQTGQHALM
ncbi:type VI secretion system baseplate subunit TssF [Photorhabdus noenieputensis]|uniref:type VI secretion system baseplate subunit TssF n=1 Tax=Photorhabdus noenieputensis TaxID=1208607 RepID=UPI001BD390B3|nr:type VI secretion system baseplate subunit TssF [Photorhabdus noenieputensis]MBS9439334.1 type VI secretion system baseplate subunit TssF [Photorhabdus noenieputensis]MCK3671521.1 type VI secretion system baseplate subunit TssF [Photorhabdus noenieputensis]